jgi:hydroxyethylthiazole kinase-like uncharacterized protein yjeF
MEIMRSNNQAMKAATVKQIQKLDRVAIDEYGMPSIILMENAGRLVAAEVLRQLKRKKNPKVSVICGLGNNAGDGFVVARHLINAGIKAKVYHFGKEKQLKVDALINYRFFKKLRFPIAPIKLSNQGLLPAEISKVDIVVDAIFGAGLNRDIQNPFKSIIEGINSSSAKIISVDIPSGLNGTTGKIYGVCIKANTTVTFSLAKKGFYKNYGPALTGKVIVVDIGIPYACYK